jgi:hypothetical protein
MKVEILYFFLLFFFKVDVMIVGIFMTFRGNTGNLPREREREDGVRRRRKKEEEEAKQHDIGLIEN